MKNIGVLVSENFQFLEVKFSIYLNRSVFVMIGIKHGFLCINNRGLGFQHFPLDWANVNAFKNHVRSLLLYKN